MIDSPEPLNARLVVLRHQAYTSAVKLLVPTLLAALLSACTMMPTNGTAKALPAEFTVMADLQHPKSKVPEANLEVELLDIRDSRCPADVQCVWAGDAVVSFAARSLSSNNQSPQVFELHTNLEPRHVAVGGYDVTLESVAPLPTPADASQLKQTQHVMLHFQLK